MLSKLFKLLILIPLIACFFNISSTYAACIYPDPTDPNGLVDENGNSCGVIDPDTPLDGHTIALILIAGCVGTYQIKKNLMLKKLEAN